MVIRMIVRKRVDQRFILRRADESKEIAEAARHPRLLQQGRQYPIQIQPGKRRKDRADKNEPLAREKLTPQRNGPNHAHDRRAEHRKICIPQFENELRLDDQSVEYGKLPVWALQAS